MEWFKKIKQPLKQEPAADRRMQVPEGLWVKCEGCREIIYRKEVARNFNTCPKCNYHFRITATERLQALLDEDTFEELDSGVAPADPLRFRDSKPYRDRLRDYQKKTGLRDALRSYLGRIDGVRTVLCILDYDFMGGSMGSVMGEKITRAIETALREGVPLVVVSASGGARMQEGVLSLMQMAKISAALARLDDAGIPFISILTDPTTGGVTASFAMLGDLNVAEPRALIGFAGPRVIEQTIKEQLPEGFQRSEFLMDHGMLDLVVDRKDLKSTIARILRLLVDGTPAASTALAAPAPATGA